MTRLTSSRRRYAAAMIAATMAAAVLVVSPATAAHAAAAVDIDYSQSVGQRSPLVFGGAINELDGSADVATLREAGTTFARRDVYLSQILPQTTVNQYLADMSVAGGVDDPNTWNWNAYTWIDTYDAAGLKTMIILSYNVGWLSQSGNNNGVPKNWTVYKDIVKKIVTRFASKIDYVEVWNEPDHSNFLDLTGSGYSSRLDAYKEIYRNAAQAVKQVSTSIPVGGPALSTTDTSWANAMLQDAGIAANVDFLSYHQYQKNPDGEVAVPQLRSVASANGKPNMPIYLTEWNWDWQYIGSSMNNDSVDAIPYVAQRLDNLIYQNAAGSAYFAFNKQTTHPDFYSLKSDGSPTPKLSVYRLMSKRLGLGAGTFQLNSSSWVNSSATLVARGATLSSGDRAAWIVNTSSSGDNVSVNLKGLTPGQRYSVVGYEASQWQDARGVSFSGGYVADATGKVSVTFWMPYRAVVGLKIATVTQTISKLESSSSTGQYVRHQNSRGRIDPLASVTPTDDRRFIVVEGLAGPGTVSLQSVNFPGSYLRHRDGEIWLDRNDGTSLFQQDASWTQVTGLSGSGTSFRSVNYPSNYLQEQASLLYSSAATTATAKLASTFTITSD